MNRSTFWMNKYMNGSVFSKARYMNGVGFEILARTPVPKLSLSSPPSPPPPPPEVLSITIYPFSRHRSPYASAPVNKMPSFCAMAKECDIFSFELHSNMLNHHWNGDIFNRRFVISPSTCVLHICLSPNRQNLTTLASGEICLFVLYYTPGDRAKTSALFQLTPTFNAT